MVWLLGQLRPLHSALSPPSKLGYFDQDGDVQACTERATEYLSAMALDNAMGAPSGERAVALDRIGALLHGSVVGGERWTV